MIKMYVEALKKYAVFEGRARRFEFWSFVAINFIILIILGVAEAVIGISHGVLMGIYALAVLLPNVAVSVRRLHDINFSGWFYLLAFIPTVGQIILLVFFVLPGTKGMNRFGKDPLETEAIAPGTVPPDSAA